MAEDLEGAGATLVAAISAGTLTITDSDPKGRTGDGLARLKPSTPLTGATCAKPARRAQA